jgi:hypothetical protein
MSNIASAEEPIVTREVLIAADKNSTITPLAIASTHDNGVITAGSMGFNGWAVKTDMEGKVLWSYSIPRQYIKSRYPMAVEIRGVVPMPDGTAYLCGNIPRAPDSNDPSAFLVHLDASGKLLNEKCYTPAATMPEQEGNEGDFTRCIRWGDGLAIVGNSGRIVRVGGEGLEPIITRFNWVVALDGSGNVKWDRQIPIPSDHSGTTLGTIFTNDQALMFSAWDASVTDVFRIGVKGEIIAQKTFPGYFDFVVPVVPSDALQIIGYTDKQALEKSHATEIFVMDLNGRLEETSRTTSVLKNFMGQTYRLPSESFVVLGQRAHHLFGQPMTSGVVYTDHLLEHEHYLELPRTREPEFLDAGRHATAPGQIPGEFVQARSLAQMPASGITPNTPPVFRGMVLDFLRVSH